LLRRRYAGIWQAFKVGMASMQHPFERLTQIVEQMPTVGHLSCLRRAVRRPAGIFGGAVPRNHFDRGTRHEPVP
jgi:hypothetical protein